MIKSLAAVAPARDNHVLVMEWLKQHRGWITLIVLAAIYYPWFGKGSEGIALYTAAGRCIWHGQALLPCEPMFSYQPALAALMVPIAVLPAALQKLVWYVICAGSLVLTVRLAETMAERLYPGATHGRNLIWLRTVNLLLCSKYILLVLAYQAYQAPALAMMTLGIWALTVGREASGGFWLAAAAAIRATPLVYLPYLLLKRRYLAGVAFVAGFVAISFLPDMIGALRGGHTGYVQDWIRLTMPAIAPGMTPGPTSSLPYWNDWVGQSSGHNQSLRGLVNRFAAGPVFGLSPRVVLVAVDGAFALMTAAILLMSPRDKAYAAVDGAVLLIAVLALSPMTSLSHYIIVLPVVILVGAAVINDRRMRAFGGVVLATSFILMTGTSNDLTQRWTGEFAYQYGFITEGAIVLLAALAAMAGVWRPPGVAAVESHSLERSSAVGAQVSAAGD